MTATPAEAPDSRSVTPRETASNRTEVVTAVVDLAEFWRACNAKGWRSVSSAAAHLDVQASWLSKVLNRRVRLGGDTLIKLHIGLRDVTTFERLIKYVVRPAE